LYIAVRADLTPGQQLAQSVHAAFQFSVEHPELAKSWHTLSNYLVVVAVRDENELVSLWARAYDKHLMMSYVREPDYDNQVTALALEPGDIARRLCSQYPLALKEKAVV
jgi:peptidyl-tRNA hydrolase